MPVTSINPEPSGHIVIVGDWVEWTRRGRTFGGVIAGIEPGSYGNLIIDTPGGGRVRRQSSWCRLPHNQGGCDHIDPADYSRMTA